MRATEALADLVRTGSVSGPESETERTYYVFASLRQPICECSTQLQTEVGFFLFCPTEFSEALYLIAHINNILTSTVVSKLTWGVAMRITPSFLEFLSYIFLNLAVLEFELK